MPKTAEEISPNFDQINLILKQFINFNTHELRYIMIKLSQFPVREHVEIDNMNILFQKDVSNCESEMISKLLRQEVPLDNADPSIVEKMMAHPEFTHLLQEKISKMCRDNPEIISDCPTVDEAAPASSDTATDFTDLELPELDTDAPVNRPNRHSSGKDAASGKK